MIHRGAVGEPLVAPPSVATDLVQLENGATASWLTGERLFLQHGPVNLILRAEGSSTAVDTAYRALMGDFSSWLGALVDELPRLRCQEYSDLALPEGIIARRMVMAVRACTSGSSDFVTPMAAVAGAIADQAVAQLTARPGIERVYVNNGGDIAIHLVPGTHMSVGVVPHLHEALARASFEIGYRSPVRGVATSGWQGRSHSLGIADAVTVLAGNAAVADAAATLIANAVNIYHPDVRRVPACTIDEDSDLGAQLVTVEVPKLDAGVIDMALEAGLSIAEMLQNRGVIDSAALTAQGRWRVLATPELSSLESVEDGS